MIGYFIWEALPLVVAVVGLFGGVALIVHALAPARPTRDLALGPARPHRELTLAGGVVLLCAGLVASSIVGLAAVGGALRGLGDPPGTYVGLSNDTDEPVAVYYGSGGAERLQMVLWPDQSDFLAGRLLSDESRCTTADLVFRNGLETELGRLPPPVCATRMINLGQCVQSGLQPPPPCLLPTPRPRPSPSPIPTPQPTSPPPPTLPPGGLSEEDAVRLALSQVAPPRQLVAVYWGELGDMVFDEEVPEVPRDRLVWAVALNTMDQPACPSAGDCLPPFPSMIVILDFRSGDYITTQNLF